MAQSSAPLIMAIIAMIIAIVAIGLAIFVMMRPKADTFNIIDGSPTDTIINGSRGNFYTVSNGVSSIGISRPGSNPKGQGFTISNAQNAGSVVLTPTTQGVNIAGSNVIPPGGINDFVWVSNTTIQNVTSSG